MLNLVANGPSGYTINNSLRFRSSASAYLSRTPGSAGNQQKFTYSAWVKKAVVNSSGSSIFAVNGGGSYGGFNITFGLNSSDDIGISAINTSGTNQIRCGTAAVFRDPSAWYHIVVAIDTTQATNSNGVKVYVNNVQQTLSFSTYTQNFNCFVNGIYGHLIGANQTVSGGISAYLDGYQAEVYLIDGQQLTPSSFGSTNSTTGVWQPAKYTGTYGTNGFYLPFSLGTTSTYAGSFNGSNQYLSLPSSSAWDLSTGNWTIECWFKFSSISSNGSAIAGNADVFYGNGGWGVRLDSSYAIILYGNGNSQGSYAIGSTALSANQWHHLAIVRSGTGASSVSLYLDGVPYTATGNGANNPTFASSSTGIAVGYGNYASSYFNGNISNLRIVKGYAQYSINASGISVPSAPLTAVTGTSLLTLQNATIIDNSSNAFTITNNNTVTSSTATPFVANIFGDKSGNNNDWAGNNINYTTSGTTYDAMTDVPTLTSATVANYCVINPIASAVADTYSQANLKWTKVNNSTNSSAVGSIAISSGKWYWEGTVATAGGSNLTIGIGNTDTNFVSLDSNLGMTGSTTSYAYNGGTGPYKQNNNTQTSYGATYTANDVIGVAFDADAGTITFYKNNVSQGTAYTGITGTYYPACGGRFTNDSWYMNFGQRPFTYTPPTGYVALNTYNLPTSTIVQGNKYMDATLYTGNGSTQSITNTAGFKPDLVWVKSRSAATDHKLTDSVRGVTKALISDTTGAETTDTNGLTAFNSNGWSLGTDTNYNNNTATYVGWQWQAGQGSSSSNTSGNVTSTVSVNTSVGFSIVTYTVTTTVNMTIGHGLGVAPKFIIEKRRDGAANWDVYHASLGNTGRMILNTTGAFDVQAGVWNNTTPTSTVFSQQGNGNWFPVGATVVAYCWAAIPGFSAFGSYVGNGSSDGPFIFTNFRPKFVMWKRTDTTGGWNIIDSSRDTYNVSGNFLYPNLSNAEGAGTYGDLLSNGFKIRTGSDATTNASGGTYVYACFAENPLKNALAR